MPYRNGEYYTRSEAAEHPRDDQTARDVAGMDLLDVFGFQRREREYQDALGRDRNRAYWDSLSSPTAEQLDSREGRDAESQALARLSQYAGGGLTSADRAGLEAQRARDAQGARASQQSIMQSAQARGTGGGGLDYLTRQQASQLGQQQSSDAYSQALQGAQQRGLAATTALGAMGSQLRDEAAHGSLQQSYENQLQRAAGATGQYGTDASMRSRGRQEDQQNRAGLLGLIGGLLG